MFEKKLTLMAIFAHPDDEAFGTGGTLAKYAAEGCDVYVVTATRGEAGQIADPEVASPSNLPAVRERELRCACQTYGVHPPRFLDYVDGQLAIVNQGQAVAKLVRLIRELRPDVVITFGQDGIYGHYDHVVVHRWASIAVELAADPDWPTDGSAGLAHQVKKLYYRTMIDEAVTARSKNGQRAAVMMDGVPFYFASLPATEISTIIDVGLYADVKRQGILCHATQLGHTSRYSESPEEVIADPWFRQEAFILAQSTVGPPDNLEQDLFRGLR
ncbi:MAG: PIG-L family deacetylase [Chloroflexota bacterium]|nr:PIG-L family deacetylase [Chloroflexota bacterium]